MTKLNTTLLKDLPIKQTSITDNDYVVVSSGGTKKLKIKDITKDIEKKAADLEERATELSEQLEHIMQYPVLDIEIDEENLLLSTNVIDRRYPYLHVNRYGAINDGVTDCTKAIQKAIDLAENYFSKLHNVEEYPVQFESGIYLITDNLKIKCDKNKSAAIRPIYFKGKACNYMQGVGGGKGTQIKALIKKNNGFDYDSAICVNVDFKDDAETEKSAYGETMPITQVANISFENLVIQVGSMEDGSFNEEEYNKYNIVGIKSFNARLNLKNVFFNGMYYGVYQPKTESQCSDMSEFKQIFINRPKKGGLYLNYSDCTIIEHIQSYYLNQNTLDSLIHLNGGHSITVTNIHGAGFGDFENGEFIPRNLGSGRSGTKALIKIDSCKGVNVKDLYFERPFLDYVFAINKTDNLIIENYNDMFIGNGFIKFTEKNSNIKLENIYRYSNLIDVYDDIFFASQDVCNLKVSNFVRRKFYAEDFTLNSDYRVSVLTKLLSYVYEHIKIEGLTRSMMEKNIQGEKLKLNIYYADGWKIRNTINEGKTHLFGNLTWDADSRSLDIRSLLDVPFSIENVFPMAVSSSSVQIPIVFEDDTRQKIRLFKNNELVILEENGLSFGIDINLLDNNMVYVI